MNQTGRTSVGRRRQASRNLLFIEAIRILYLVASQKKNAKVLELGGLAV
jgi:hypothetical protein